MFLLLHGDRNLYDGLVYPKKWRELVFRRGLPTLHPRYTYDLCPRNIQHHQRLLYSLASRTHRLETPDAS